MQLIKLINLTIFIAVNKISYLLINKDKLFCNYNVEEENLSRIISRLWV